MSKATVESSNKDDRTGLVDDEDPNSSALSSSSDSQSNNSARKFLPENQNQKERGRGRRPRILKGPSRMQVSSLHVSYLFTVDYGFVPVPFHWNDRNPTGIGGAL